MNWPTFITSVSTAVIVAFLAAFLNPGFQHLFWKRRKLREQRVQIAERFAALHSNFTLARAAEVDFSSRFEEDALLVLVQVLFEREQTLLSCNRLKAWLDNHGIKLSASEKPSILMEVWTLRIDLLSRLFAEAFEMSSDGLEKKPTLHKGPA